MRYIESKSTDAAFHFSVEEYFMQRSTSKEPVVMIWQTGKCAMLGSYQLADAELDMSFAKEQNLQIVRRSSGGGTIFTDSGTLLYSMILPCTEQSPQQTAKEALSKSVVSALGKMGVPVKVEGRNDIVIDGKKFSGMAQYIRSGRICSHCSLLYDADLEMLARVLTVDDEKIQSKAIRSVRSRVTNLKNYFNNPLSTPDFLKAFKKKLFEDYEISEYPLLENDLKEINVIYNEKYANPAWTFGKSPSFTFRNSKRFVGGKVDVFFNVENGAVTSCSIRGDFLGIASICELEKSLEMKAFQYHAFDDVLSGIALNHYLGSITKEQLLSCIFV